jgi:regulatory protein
MAVCYFMQRKITGLKVQKRNPNRVNVYLDGEFAFGLARIVAAWLQIGQTLEDQKIAALQNQDEQEAACQAAMRLLDRRPHTAEEIRRKLYPKGYQPETVDAVLERLRNSGLVSDLQFARAWIENRAAFRPRSHRAVALELRQKGVTEEDIQTALEGSAEEEDLALLAAQRYAKTWRTPGAPRVQLPNRQPRHP